MKNYIYTYILNHFDIYFLWSRKEKIISQMVEEVSFLASDKLEGRETGSLEKKLLQIILKKNL